MSLKNNKLGVLVASVVVAVLASGGIALAQSSLDTWTPAGTPVTATSTNSAFVGPLTISCSTFQLSGTTPSPFPDNSTIAMTASASGCNHVPTFHAPWSVTIHSNSGGYTSCPVGSSAEDDDCITATIPAGAVTFASVPLCGTLTVPSSNFTTPPITYNDNDDTNPGTFVANVANVPYKCSTGITGTGTFKGNFAVSPVLDDDGA